jgi:hypothetical protein
MIPKQIGKIAELAARTRRRKVQAVRRQLKRGKYDTNSRLTAILDRILEDLSV